MGLLLSCIFSLVLAVFFLVPSNIDKCKADGGKIVYGHCFIVSEKVKK